MTRKNWAVWLAFVPVAVGMVCLCMKGLDAWQDWDPHFSLSVRADQSAIVCAVCAVIGLCLLTVCTVKLHKLEKRGRQ